MTSNSLQCHTVQHIGHYVMEIPPWNLRLQSKNPFHISAPKYSLSSCFEKFITQVTRVKFEEKNKFLSFILGKSKWKITLSAKKQEVNISLCGVFISYLKEDFRYFFPNREGV